MDDLVGRLVISKAGRDKGKPFVITKVINNRFVILLDGDLRKVENPKVKSIKHCQVTVKQIPEIVQAVKKGEVLENHQIRKLVRNLWLTYQGDEEGGCLDG
ncbi:MAG: hypothetical protein ACM3MK_02800 [Chitinophagales bacterium]